MSRWGGPPPPPPREESPQVRYGLDPQVLMSSGILRNPAVPEEALERASRLCAQARFREARATLVPHLNNADSTIAADVRGLLAECALRGVGTDPREAIEEALAACRRSGDRARLAMVSTLRGELLLETGELDPAEEALQEARRIHLDAGETRAAARAQALLARVALLRGDANRALELTRIAADEAGDGTDVAASVRLIRANVQAHRNAPDDVARDLVEAERLLRSRVSAADRLRPRIARAETLLVLGFDSRALRGLRKLLIDVVSLEDTQIQARVHLLLGLAALREDATFARRHLMRARHLYDSYGAAYGATRADIGLLRVEHRLGLNPRPRLQGLESRDLTQWPLLAAQLNIARVEIHAGARPAVCRRKLLEERERAASKGQRALMSEIDQALVDCGLAGDDIRDLTPVERRHRRTLRVAGQPLPAVLTEVRPEPAVNLPPKSGRGVTLRADPTRPDSRPGPTVRAQLQEARDV